MPNTKNKLSCDKIIVTRHIKKPNGDGHFDLKYQLPKKVQLKEYLKKNGKSEADAEYMSRVYCGRMTGCSTAQKAWDEFYKHYEIDHSWWKKDFEFVFRNMLVTMSDFPLEERLKKIEDYLLQRGPFGQDGLDAREWLVNEGLFYSDDPSDLIPAGREMKEYEYEIKKFMLRKDIGETVELIKKFREDSNGFTLSQGFNKWMDNNGLGGLSECSCSCIDQRSKRHVDKANGGSFESQSINTTLSNFNNESSTHTTTGEKLAAAVVGTTALTGTAAAIFGTGGGAASTGAIGAAATTAGTLAAANTTAAAGGVAAAVVGTGGGVASTGVLSTVAGLSLAQIAGGCLGGFAAVASGVAFYKWWVGGGSGAGGVDYNKDIVDGPHDPENPTCGREYTRGKLKKLTKDRKTAKKLDKGLELSLLR